MVLEIAPGLTIDEAELSESFVTSSGPGGQNVNKVATAVQLRFDVLACQTLPPALKARLQVLAGRRMTQAGVLVIAAQRFASQDRNRQDARARLLELVRAAAEVPVRRIKTRTPRAEKRRRLESKAQRSTTKRLRSTISD